MALEVLIVDDEQDIRELVAGVLEDEGYQARTAADSDAALAALAERRPSLVLLDVWLQGSRIDGLDLLDEIKRRDPTLPVLVISGHGNIDTAVAAIHRGATDFIEKPFEAEKLLHLVARATETDRLRRENASLRAQIGQEEELNGNSGAINAVRATLKRVAATGSRVLISGPAGVGKEVAARLLHLWSPRADAPFIVVSAARMTPERVEEELFGAEDGQDQVRPGLLEQAHGGTLFLDEIADMPLTAQAKILRVLTDQSFTRIGGQRMVKVDVRVVSATSRTLSEEIAAGRFREDLYYRLNVVSLVVPPLRERRDDVPLLASYFVRQHATRCKRQVKGISPEARKLLMSYDWPGNVRELSNAIERAVVLGSQDVILLEDLPENLLESAQPENEQGFHGLVADGKRDIIRQALDKAGGNVALAARDLGLQPTYLHRLIRNLAINRP
jgi:two-component system, NtrC family, nitrogen regulation response regulator NtrX